MCAVFRHKGGISFYCDEPKGEEEEEGEERKIEDYERAYNMRVHFYIRATVYSLRPFLLLYNQQRYIFRSLQISTIVSIIFLNEHQAEGEGSGLQDVLICLLINNIVAARSTFVKLYPFLRANKRETNLIYKLQTFVYS